MTFGLDEIGGPVERRVRCEVCDEFFPVKDTEMSRRLNRETGEYESNPNGFVLQYFKCHCGMFLLGINNKSVMPSVDKSSASCVN